MLRDEIRISSVERDGGDGLIVTFSDETIAAYVVEELLGLRPHREPVEKVKVTVKSLPRSPAKDTRRHR
jgi:hypothetical protein